MSRLVFINLPVADPKRSIAFFKELGFEHNPQFTDETGACIVISDIIHVMVLSHEKFGTFTPNDISDATKSTEVITALSCENRGEVDDLVKRAVAAGVHIYMTVQTLWGYVQMYVYDTGRDLMEMGIIPCGNMLPEVAFMKLNWALGHSHDREEVKKLMLTPIAGELTPREPPDSYLIYQGGLPDIEKFIKDHKM